MYRHHIGNDVYVLVEIQFFYILLFFRVGYVGLLSGLLSCGVL